MNKMIYSNITVTISGGQSKINEKIILFRGDRDVQVSFEIIQTSFKFAKGENVINTKEAGYGQLIIEKPDKSHIFSEITECENGRVIFTITADMIDELNEVGSYAIQIRLFDSTAGSRITLPAISNAIEVHQPMASEDLSEVAKVDTASIDYAVINDEGELDDFFNDDNSYKLTQWYTGDKITAGRMNKIEGAIYEINDKIENVEIPTKVSELENDKGYLTEHQSLANYATKDEIPTKVSELENDKGYLTEHQSLTDYATKTYVGEEIAKAQLEGEEVDLSVYATKDEIPTKVSELENDKGYLTEHQSLANYATKEEIPTKVSELENDKNYLTSIPSEYVTDTELNDKGYLTEHQSLTDYATKTYVGEEIAKAQLEGEDVDLSSYATKAEIPTNISQLTNDSGYLTSIPSEYVTDTELNAKGYLTEHQSLADYATKSYVDEAINALRTELMALIESGGNIVKTEIWAYKDDDYTDATANEDIIKVYVELTSSNYTTRPKDVLQYYPNCKELYLFDDGSVVTLENIFSAGDILEVDTVEFMDGYFGKATSLQNSFKNQTYIKVVKNLPNSVTNMNACFYGCTALTQAPTLPSNLTNLTSAFFNCKSLTQAPDIPSKVTTMAYCFRGCSNLTTPPTIYTDVVTNMSSSFHDCAALTAVTIPLRITSYGNYLNGCKALVDITWSGERTTNFSLGTDGLNAPSYTQDDIQELVTGHLANLGGSSATLTLGETYLAYLTEEEKAAAAAKGWTLV